MVDEGKLQQAFKEALALQREVSYESLTFAKSDGWDSIAHMRLIAEIESAFGIMIDIDDVLAMSDYSVAKRIVEKYVGA